MFGQKLDDFLTVDWYVILCNHYYINTRLCNNDCNVFSQSIEKLSIFTGSHYKWLPFFLVNSAVIYLLCRCMISAV